MSRGERRLIVGPLQSLWYPRAVASVVVMVMLLVVLTLALAMTGSYRLAAADVVMGVFQPGANPASTIMWELRLPRIATGLATGACLGVSGLLFQSLSRNALGSPEIIGLVSGAALGAVVGITLLGTSGWTTSLAAVAGCAVAVVLAQMMTSQAPGSVGRLVLVGIGLSALWSSLTSLLLTRTDPDVAVGGQMWLTGSLNARTWQHAVVPAVALLVTVPLAVVRSRHLGVLDSGPDMTAQLGVSASSLGRLVGVLGVVLTGAAIASTGPISFVALAAPHLARRLAGRGLVPVVTSAVTGSTLLLLAEWAARQLPETMQVPVGIATSVLGGIYLIILVIRRPQ